jgi:long-subunit fatty acid transport protein
MPAGIYHEFENNDAATFDIIWSDFSSFKLSEIYIDGNSIADNDARYEDIWSVSASYRWPLNERLMLGVSGLYADAMIKDEERTMT